MRHPATGERRAQLGRDRGHLIQASPQKLLGLLRVGEHRLALQGYGGAYRDAHRTYRHREQVPRDQTVHREDLPRGDERAPGGEIEEDDATGSRHGTGGEGGIALGLEGRYPQYHRYQQGIWIRGSETRRSLGRGRRPSLENPGHTRSLFAVVHLRR